MYDVFVAHVLGTCEKKFMLLCTYTKLHSKAAYTPYLKATPQNNNANS